MYIDKIGSSKILELEKVKIDSTATIVRKKKKKSPAANQYGKIQLFHVSLTQILSS
jgi:hypothetical protein